MLKVLFCIITKLYNYLLAVPLIITFLKNNVSNAKTLETLFFLSIRYFDH